ncbi:hypothetical protein E2562_010696 [Oryza meyeriana var. granulata]|uniref:DUF834 domain-containing protein n=1 Tax=Oryza meyeriana var. granulata TaxID=110450 RepID=A0A6G1EW36_9ORYZ|nr:hypothetical protein E2562_010696 [Oryza meyeriana var. granulata]
MAPEVGEDAGAVGTSTPRGYGGDEAPDGEAVWAARPPSSLGQKGRRRGPGGGEETVAHDSGLQISGGDLSRGRREREFVAVVEMARRGLLSPGIGSVEVERRRGSPGGGDGRPPLQIWVAAATDRRERAASSKNGDGASGRQRPRSRAGGWRSGRRPQPTGGAARGGCRQHLATSL